jgi:serine/threonine protein kinase
MTTNASQPATKRFELQGPLGTAEPTTVATRPRILALLRSEDQPTKVGIESRLAALAARTPPEEAGTAGYTTSASALEDRAVHEATVVDTELAERIATEMALAQDGAAADRPHAAALVATKRLGKYRLLRLLSSGRTSHVYLARLAGPAGFARHLAIKLLREEHEGDPDRVDAFLEKARLFATLHHGNIAQICDIGADGTSRYMVMDYLHGTTLRTVLRRAPSGLPLAFAITAISSCAEALHHARARQSGEAHRILRIAPSCVMACSDGAIKLVNLGHTRSPAIKLGDHEFAYLAPEQARGESCDARGEVFALGVMLYELLAGAHPFLDPSSEPTSRTTRDRLLYTEVEPLTTHVPHLPSELSAVVMTAIARDPDLRYRDCREFGEALFSVAARLGLRLGPAAVRHLVSLLPNMQPAKGPALAPISHSTVVADVRSIEAKSDGMATPTCQPACPPVSPSTHASDLAPLATERATPSPPPSLPLSPPPARMIARPCSPRALPPVWAGPSPQAPPLMQPRLRARGTSALFSIPSSASLNNDWSRSAERSTTLSCRTLPRRKLRRMLAVVGLFAITAAIAAGLLIASGSSAKAVAIGAPSPSPAPARANAPQPASRRDPEHKSVHLRPIK